MPVDVEKLLDTFGKDVFTDRGEYCGQVENVKVDLDRFRIGSIVLKADKRTYLGNILGGKKGVVIPYQFVKAIGDIVIIKHISPDSLSGGEKKEAEVEPENMGEVEEPSEQTAETAGAEEPEEDVSLPF
ncbi:MAG: PRC-barrel domain-containing protein [Candidatus Aenigmatarchaeota archaeon]